jgi:hypothetical protein
VSDAAQPDANVCAASTTYPQTTFVNLAVPLGAALTPGQSDGDAGVPVAGWDFHQAGVCRDGSPAGFYVHYSSTGSNELYIDLAGGGLCDSATFCSHNPANLQTTLAGGAATSDQTIASTYTFASTGQVPYPPAGGYSPGIFDTTNPSNPFMDWNAVYVPYCTGDDHFGTHDSVDIPGDATLPGLSNQHFVGHTNLQSYIGRIVPTFPNVTKVLLTGSDAGGLGALLNYGMVQDTFGRASVSVIDDSGPLFADTSFAPCFQKELRSVWGIDAALPSDCAECDQANGGGLGNLVDYWLQKYRSGRIGLISTVHDEVARLDLAQSLNTCASNDATVLTLGQVNCGGYSCDTFAAGLQGFATTFGCTNRVGEYLVGGNGTSDGGLVGSTDHDHLYRSEFTSAIPGGTTTMAQWAAALVDGSVTTVGP